MPFEKGHKHSENWYQAVRKPRPQHVKDAVSSAQKGRTHEPHEGFQKGHAAYEGTKETRFRSGLVPWNKGNRNRDPAKLKYRTYKANAKKRGMVWEITLEEMRGFLSSPCVYCGDQSTGVDRIDNTLGYIKGNMAACCQICNHMKHTMGREDFIDKCRKIAARYEFSIRH
jgi:hypothetical protein